MPRLDGTGPNGVGPRTGRAAGFCGGFGQQGAVNAGGRGAGFGRGACGGAFGGGRGRGNRFFAGGPGYGPRGGYYGEPFLPEGGDRADIIARLENLTAELDALRQRLSSLEKSGE